MKPIPVFLATWGLAGLGAVAGSILGNAVGTTGLFAGAIVGGVLFVGLAAVVLARLRWLPAEDRRAAFLGGAAGFAVAAPIAVMNLHTPVTPVLVCSLAGFGLLLGATVARRRRGGARR